MILDGKKLADQICNDLKIKVDDLRAAGVQPELIIVTSGDNDASKVYVRNKVRRCEEIGINVSVEHHDYLTAAHVDEVCRRNKPAIFQMPIEGNQYGLDLASVSLKPHCDVDGFVAVDNIVAIATGDKPYHYPCTPLGIMELLKKYDVHLEGKCVCIIGRSNIVGRPLARMMEQAGATVTLCHSKTPKEELYLKADASDIIVSATGVRNVLTLEGFECTCGTYRLGEKVIVDVGMNRDENGKLCGDIDPLIYERCKAYTPVPGGIGQMTVAMLMSNVVSACCTGHLLVNE